MDLLQLIERLRKEADSPPYECDADSYSRGICRAIDELENYMSDDVDAD